MSRLETTVHHLRCGEDIIDALARTGLPGVATAWGDALCEGPLLPWPSDAARRTARAAWAGSRYGLDEPGCLAMLERADRGLAAAEAADETVLWFEHDLFDQIILVFLLTRLKERAAGTTALICIGEHPAVPEFRGLGQLSAAQLAALHPTRLAVSPEMFALASAVWDDLTRGSMDGVHTHAASEGAGEGTREVMPFLPAALTRYLAELPSTRTGLSLSEQLALQAIGAGADTPGHAFVAAQRFEDAPWQGDLMFYGMLAAMARAPVPLLRSLDGPLPAAGERRFAHDRLGLTTEGRAVLTGRLDWCRLGRPPRWHGGVRLEGEEPLWRWDEATARPVRRD